MLSSQFEWSHLNNLKATRLKGDHSNLVAEKVSTIRGITSVSLVTGSVDIMSTCLFRETADLFNIIESIKTLERVDTVSWAEEVHNIPSKESMIFSSLVQESINTSEYLVFIYRFCPKEFLDTHNSLPLLVCSS